MVCLLKWPRINSGWELNPTVQLSKIVPIADIAKSDARSRAAPAPPGQPVVNLQRTTSYSPHLYSNPPVMDTRDVIMPRNDMIKASTNAPIIAASGQRSSTVSHHLIGWGTRPTIERLTDSSSESYDTSSNPRPSYKLKPRSISVERNSDDPPIITVDSYPSLIQQIRQSGIPWIRLAFMVVPRTLGIPTLPKMINLPKIHTKANSGEFRIRLPPS